MARPKATFAEALNILRPELRMRTEQRLALQKTRSALQLLGGTITNLLLPLLPELRGRCAIDLPDHREAVAEYALKNGPNAVRIKWINGWCIHGIHEHAQFYVGRCGTAYYALRKGNRDYERFMNMPEHVLCVLPCGLLVLGRNGYLFLMDWQADRTVRLRDYFISSLEYKNDHGVLKYWLLDDYGETCKRFEGCELTPYISYFAYAHA